MKPVLPYAGQNQSARINGPARIAYEYIDWEEGPWVMPPYAWLYPPVTTLEEPSPWPLVTRGRAPVRRIRWVPW